MLRTVALVQDADQRLTARAADRTPHDQGATAASIQSNAFGQLLRVTAPDAGTTRLAYDARHELTGVVDANGVATTDHRDDFGRTIWRQSADTGRTVYAYDRSDHPIREIDAGGRAITRAFNAAGRLIEQTTPAGETRFSYAHGRLIRARGPTSDERFAYNRQGRLAAHTRLIDGHRWTTRYTYSRVTGRRLTKSLPDGQVLRYHDDPASARLRAITRDDWFSQTTVVGAIGYQPFGPIAQWTHGNGDTTRLQRNARGQITEIARGHGPEPALSLRCQGPDHRHPQRARRPVLRLRRPGPAAPGGF